MVEQACRSLSASESSVAGIASASLLNLSGRPTLTAALRHIQKPESHNKSSRSKFACRSRWSTLNKAIITIELRETEGSVKCWVGHKHTTAEKLQPGAVYRGIRVLLASVSAESLRSQPHQGRCFDAIGRDASLNHFLCIGLGLRFADWRFAHSRRLDCCQVNAHEFGAPGPRNCRCHFASESLGHILSCCNHCNDAHEAVQRACA